MAAMSSSSLWSFGTAACVTVACTALGCADSKPPPRWAEGGAPLHLVSAQWSFKGETVDIQTRGDFAEVLVDGDVELVIDRVGRLYDRHQNPIAVLETDGRLVGKKDQLLGMVGASYAAKPGRASAWLGFTPTGDILKYSPDGSAESAGRWVGCQVSPYAQHACLLVSYALYWEDEGDEDVDAMGPMTPGYGPGGVGIGVGR